MPELRTQISFSCGESYVFLDPPSVVAKSKMTLLILGLHSH